MKCTWDPWFADSSRLAFISGKSVVASSPDGRSQQTIVEAGEQIGLATPSPDGKVIAYIKSAAQEDKQQRHGLSGVTPRSG
jgi:Tol biopolymer transport system component